MAIIRIISLFPTIIIRTIIVIVILGISVLGVPILGISVLGFSDLAFARPVSYPEGWTVMQMNNADRNTLHIHYSPTVKYSIGYKAEYRREKEWQFHGAQFNYLAKRWNAPASQANFYLKSGAGFAYSDFKTLENEIEPAVFGGIAFDLEDRRYFTSYENRSYYAGDIDKFFTQTARFGIAPYIGNFGDLHTWLILEMNNNPSSDDEVSFTPMIRFFKGDYLTELGVSDNGDFSFNLIIRF